MRRDATSDAIREPQGVKESLPVTANGSERRNNGGVVSGAGIS
jgi:hypothetical protein